MIQTCAVWKRRGGGRNIEPSGGDEAVKAALDQLIEAHHDAAAHITHGQSEGGEATRAEGAAGTLLQLEDVVYLKGIHRRVSQHLNLITYLRPDVATIRLKPNDARRYMISARPEDAFKSMQSLSLTLDPPAKELQVTRTTQLMGEEITLKFVEPRILMTRN